jgi:hypothetical protein
MAAVELRLDLSALITALVANDKALIRDSARTHLKHGDNISVILGRVGIIASQGDPAGHPTITLAAAAILSRLLHTLPEPLDPQVQPEGAILSFFVAPLLAAADAVRAGNGHAPQLPAPFYPSALGEERSVNEAVHQAIYANDALMTERLLLGLHSTGADYRALEARSYEGIATTFQDTGHPLIFTVRGFQLLDAVEWGEYTPTILHWLTPHLPLRPDAEKPDWVATVDTFASDPAHDMTSIRTRLAAPKDESALPLHKLLLSDADTAQVCQGVYDAIIKGGASPNGVGSIIALAAADVLNRVGDSDRALFVHVAHGLLFASAIHNVFNRIQDVEVLPLLFTSAAFINSIQKDVATQQEATDRSAALTHPSASIIGGGLIAASQLETLSSQLKARDLVGAIATTRRYFLLGHDPRALFATIAIAASWTDASSDQGHTLQIVQAASEEYLNWPATLSTTNHEIFLQVALRSAAFGSRMG